MDLGEIVIVAGIGCRRGVSADDVGAAIDAALLQTQTTGRPPVLIAIPAAKEHEAGVHAAAGARGIRVALIAQAALETADARTLTRSVPSMAAMNVHCVAEAAALAAAGPGGRLLGPRVGVGPVTCALAEAV